jgi:nitrate reductase NapE component
MLQDLQLCLTYTKPFQGGDDCEMKGGQLDLEQLSLFQGSDENQDRPEYLRDDLVFKMIVMSLLCITKLQTTGRFGFVVLMFPIYCIAESLSCNNGNT